MFCSSPETLDFRRQKFRGLKEIVEPHQCLDLQDLFTNRRSSRNVDLPDTSVSPEQQELVRRKLYAVRAINRVPAGSCHFSCSTDPSQSVVSFPCVQKRERIKMNYATNALALAHWLWLRCSRPANRRLQWSALSVGCRALNFWCMPIVPFVFSGRPQGLQASME